MESKLFSKNLTYSILENPNYIKHIHFIGISGISMRGLAVYTLKTFNHIKITGNTNLNDFYINDKISINVPIENFINNIDICIYTSSILDNNIELIKIKDFNKLNNNKIILLKRSEYLNLITSNKERIGVLGAHGKTSITTYIHQILDNLNPITFIGANVKGYENTYLIKDEKKNPEIYIVENDESEKGFLNLTSEYTIIPNISNDHLDNYNNSFKDYLNTFRKYFQLVKDKNKYIIYNKNNKYANDKSKIFNEILDNLIKESNLKYISYGDNAHVNIEILETKNRTLKWKLTTDLEELKTLNNRIFTENIIGIWNIYNITSGLIMATLKNIKIEKNLNLIKPSRRLEIIYNKNNKIILDDYGVHPFEIENVIKACEDIYKDIVYIWEPHRINRLNFFKNDFKRIFANKKLFYRDIYEVNTPTENSKPISNFIDYGEYIKDTNELTNIIKDHSVIVLFSAGSLSKKIREIISNLK